MRINERNFWLGLVAGAMLAAGMLPATYAMRQKAAKGSTAVQAFRPAYTTASPAMQASRSAYTSKVVLENDRVRVKDVTFPAGVPDTGMHTHDLAHVGIILTKGSLVFTEPGGKTETVSFEPGSVGYREANVTHQVASGGSAAMRVIEVELK